MGTIDIELLPKRVRGWIDEGRLVPPNAVGGNSIALSRAITRLCGATDAPPSDKVERDLTDRIGRYPSYLFILVDGLGYCMQEHFPQDGFLSRESLPLRAVFPSTTATAVTGLYTGRWPGELGLAGWHTYLPDRQITATILPFYDRVTRQSLTESGLAAGDIIEADTLLPGFRTRTASLLFDEFSKGSYNIWAAGGTRLIGYDTIDSAVEKALGWFTGASESDEPVPATAVAAADSFLFLYLHQVDKAAHESGPASSETSMTVAEVDAALTRLRKVLPAAVRMLVTADHGLVEVPEERRFVLTPEHPMLEYLQVPPTGEGVMPVFHTKPGASNDFREFFEREYGDEMCLVSSPDAVKAGLYGPYGATPATLSRLGDFIGIAAQPMAFRFTAPGVEDYIHIGYHGGLRPDEMQVPLYLA